MTPYNLFLTNAQQMNLSSVLLLDNGEVEGLTAVNGNVAGTSVGFGTRIPCPAGANMSTLVVAGDLVHLSNAEIICGDLVTAPDTQVIGANFGHGHHLQGDIQSLTGINFSDDTYILSSLALDICSIIAIPATIGSGNSVNFVSNTNYSSQIFSVTQAQLAMATSINFIITDPSVVSIVVVNVFGMAPTFTNFAINTGGITPGIITWNFCNANSIFIMNFDFLGNILAPFSTIIITNGEIQGLVVASALAGEGSGEVNLPVCSPLSTASASSIHSFGVAMLRNTVDALLSLFLHFV